MLKRITALMLSIFILAMSASVISFAAENYTLNAEAESRYKLLRDIGIYQNDDLNKLGQNSFVTRADFLKYMIRSLNYANMPYNGEAVFSDITKDMAVYNDVMNAYQLGLIVGNNGAYRANDYITHTDAMVIALRALGYGDYCNYSGGYPAGYVSCAIRIRLIDNGYPLDSEPVTLDELTNLIVNMLTSELLVTTAIVDGNAQFDNKSEDTILSVYFDIYEIEGIVESNAVTHLNYGDAYNENFLKIGNTLVKITDPSQNNYLGYYVRAFYKYDNSSSAGSVVYISRYGNDEITVNAQDITYADQRLIEYEKDGKEKTIKLGMDTKYIFNGKALNLNGEYNDTTFDFSCGDVKVIYNDGDSTGDVVIINSYKNIVFNTYSDKDEVIYDELGYNIDLKEKAYILMDSNNNAISFDMLTQNDILSVAESKDSKYYIIKASYKRITGTIDALDTENGITDKVFVNGTGYDLSDEAKTSSYVNLYLGFSGTLFLSFDDKVVYAKEIEASAGNIGILLGLEKLESSANEYNAVIFTTDSAHINTSLAERVLLDGTKLDAEDVAVKLLNGEKRLTPKVISYETDADNKLCKIDTEALGARESEKSLHKIRNKADAILTYKSGDGNFGLRFYPSSSKVFFGVPETYGETIDYDAFAVTKLKNDYKGSIELYSLGNNPMVYDVAIVFGDYSVNTADIVSKAPLSVVESVKRVTTEDGDIMYKVALYEKTNIVEKYLDDGSISLLNSLKSGNIIRYGLNSKGYIGTIELMYDGESKTFPIDTDNDGLYVPEDNKDVRFSLGYVYQKYDNYISVVSNPDITLLDAPYAYPVKNANVYLMEKTRDGCTVTEMSRDMIKDFEKFGGAAHKVIAGTVNDQVQNDLYFVFISEE